jgi:hypothetical protein
MVPESPHSETWPLSCCCVSDGCLSVNLPYSHLENGAIVKEDDLPDNGALNYYAIEKALCGFHCRHSQEVSYRLAF